jgi:uroporphyrinogen III methyltransferase / synthase
MLPDNQTEDPTLHKSGPLLGRRIVVTRAPEQAKELAAQLSELGATVVLLPAISFAEPADSGPLDAAIASLSTFDWILFTSANAARFFGRRCKTRGVDPKVAQSGVRPLFVAVVGPATAEAAAKEGFLVGHMAQEFQGISLAKELAPDLTRKKVLIPHGDLAAVDLTVALRFAGADVTEVTAYRTLEVDSVPTEALEAVRKGEVDIISFFSASAFRSVSAKVGAEVLGRIPIAAIGPVTADAIREAGLKVTVESKVPTAKAFIAALLAHFPETTPAPN